MSGDEVLPKRESALVDLRSYITRIDKEITMVLQNLQWDRKQLLEGKSMMVCPVNPFHTMPASNQSHVERCALRSLGYSENEELLPDPCNPDAATLVKFNERDIQSILEKAASSDAIIYKAPASMDGAGGATGAGGRLPLSLARLQQAYSPQQRRALHAAAVAVAPAPADLPDLTLTGSSGGGGGGGGVKSPRQLAAELRDMRRRRAKYRGPGKTAKYSDVLRQLVRTQMELYTEVLMEHSNKQNVQENRGIEFRGASQTETRDRTKYDSHVDRRARSPPAGRGPSRDRGASRDCGPSRDRGASRDCGPSRDRGASRDCGPSLDRGASRDCGPSRDRESTHSRDTHKELKREKSDFEYHGRSRNEPKERKYKEHRRDERHTHSSCYTDRYDGVGSKDHSDGRSVRPDRGPDRPDRGPD